MIVPVRSASLMCIEKMIDEMSDARYLGSTEWLEHLEISEK